MYKPIISSKEESDFDQTPTFGYFCWHLVDPTHDIFGNIGWLALKPCGVDLPPEGRLWATYFE